MTTTVAGMKIGARVGITLIANTTTTYDAAIGDPVCGGVNDWSCQYMTGALPLLGHVTMPNVKRGTGSLAGTYPQPNAGGDVTVDLRGHYVVQATTGASNNAFTAGASVALLANGTVVPAGTASSQTIGIALNGGLSATGTIVDIVVQ